MLLFMLRFILWHALEGGIVKYLWFAVNVQKLAKTAALATAQSFISTLIIRLNEETFYDVNYINQINCIIFTIAITVTH